MSQRFSTIINLAGKCFLVEHLFDLFREVSRVYVCQNFDFTNQDNVDFKITVSKDDIDSERQFQTARQVEDAESVSDAEIESIYIYRKICDYLIPLSYNAFHGSCIKHQNLCLIFAGPSCIGKSTQSRLWKEYFDDVTYLNDDKPLLFCDYDNDRVVAHGNPWSGKLSLHTNTSAELNAIVVLDQAVDNDISIQLVDAVERFELLFQQWNIPPSKPLAETAIRLLDFICDKVDVYKASLDMTKNSVKLVYNKIYNKK